MDLAHRFPAFLSERVRKRHRLGSHRAVPPERTMRRLAPLLRLLGITRVANVTGLDRLGVPVVMVVRPNARYLDVCQGKGADLVAAKVSGIMESIERYCAEVVKPKGRAPVSWVECSREHRVIDPARLLALEGSKFHDRYPLLWNAGYDLIQGSDIWLPYELVHLDRTLPPRAGAGCFRGLSTGLASGNHVQEALVHAICEVIERDATTLWRLLPAARQRATRLDLNSVDDPTCREMLSQIAAAGIETMVWNMTSDIAVPAFLCRIVDPGNAALRAYGIAEGCGCHPARGVALLRAMAEAAQARLTMISGGRDDLLPCYYRPIGRNDIEGQLRLLRDGGPRMEFRGIAEHDGATFGEDLAWLLAALADAGFAQVVACDLSRPELEVAVVKVAIPGCEDGEGIPDYVPGRRALQAYRRAQ